MGIKASNRGQGGASPGSKEWYDLLPPDEKKKLSPCCYRPIAKRDVSFIQEIGPEVIFAAAPICVKCDGPAGELRLLGNWVPPGWTANTWAIMCQQKTTTGRYKCRQHKNGTVIPKYVDGESFESFLEHSPRVKRFLRGRKPEAAVKAIVENPAKEKRRSEDGYQPETQQEIPWEQEKEKEAYGD